MPPESKANLEANSPMGLLMDFGPLEVQAGGCMCVYHALPQTHFKQSNQIFGHPLWGDDCCLVIVFDSWSMYLISFADLQLRFKNQDSKYVP